MSKIKKRRRKIASNKQKYKNKKVAGEIAGLNVIKIINEPLTTSLAYGFGNCLNNNIIAKFDKSIIIKKNDFIYGLSRKET